MVFFQSDEFLSVALKKEAYWVGTIPSSAEERAAFFDESARIFSKDGSFATAKVGTADVQALRILEKADFGVVDTNVAFEKMLVGSNQLSMSEHIRPACPEDREAVEKIAAENLLYSRFSLDPLIVDSVAADIKAAWAGNFFSGLRGQAMLVAEQAGQCVGFIQLLFKNKDLIIDLVAVDGSARRLGLAAALIESATALAGGGWERVVVGTQIANVGSVRFYQSQGFVFAGAKYVLHGHGGQYADRNA
ncbi:MAG: GNAT family N-acetyltransferase [Pseudodesulfovibrio sp.]